MNVRTRFAPSPTGMLHVGGLRTALFAYLFAKSKGGVFALRIEDTDRERFVEGGMENIISALSWAGIEVDEGFTLDSEGKSVEKGGYGPYIQSSRLPLYQEHIRTLIDRGHAYHCFCTKERLAELRTRQESEKLPSKYDGACKALSADEVSKRVASGESFVIRMNMPSDGVTVVEDVVRGKVEFRNELIDDQVLIKADGFPTYHFAVVVDDHLMEITHVIRAEEWLPSTPKHVVLYEMFGWQIPVYAHLPLLVNEKKQKLSKRHGDVSVEDFREKGYLPGAIVNFIAFLGWNPGGEQEIFSLSELTQKFTLEQVSKSASVFNLEKLNWYNKQYMLAMDPVELAHHVAPFLQNAGVIEQLPETDIEWESLAKIVNLEKGRVNTLAEFAEALGFVFATTLVYPPEILVWKKSTRADAKEKLTLLRAELAKRDTSTWSASVMESETVLWIKNNGFGVGDVLWPMRVSLSGREHSPGPFEIAEVLGKQRTLERIDKAIMLLD